MPAGPSPSAEPASRDLTEGERAALGALLAAGAAGRVELVRALVAQAQRLGLAAQVLREALLMLVPYAGYPRALAAFAVAGLGPDLRPGAADEAPAGARAARGRAAFDAVYGSSAPRILEGLEALDPRLPAWTLEHAYGRVLARPGLAPRERELLAVAILTALGGLDEPLLGHMRGALRLGASPEQVAAGIQCVPAALGEERRAAARALLTRLGPVGA